MSNLIKVTSRNMFSMDSEIFNLNLDPYEISVCLFLECFNQGKETSTSYEVMATKCGMSRRKAINVINSLVDKGIVIKTLDKDERGNCINVYDIKLD